MATAMPRLPVELLARIFVACLPAQPYVEPNTHNAPLLLMQVCRQWREIAMQTTQLWCSLSAIQECWGVLEPMCKARMGGYAAWLSRSGNRPLSLAVPFACEERWKQEWVQCLLSYRGLFERLRVVDQEGVDLKKLLEGARMLKFLAVHWDGLDSRDHDLMIAHPLPSLQILLLDYMNVGNATLPDAAWRNLTRLALRLPRERIHMADEFIGLVSRCPNLQILIFGHLTPEYAEPGQLRLQLPPSHPNLRLLTIVLSDHTLFQPESHILILPALVYLNVRYEFGRDLEDALTEDVDQQDVTIPPPTQRFCQVVVQMNEHFHMFDLGWTNITHLDLTFRGDVHVFPTVMELCPNLENLEMFGSCCSDRSTSSLTPLTYPSLRKLFIQVKAPLGDILQTVTLPGLQHLSISVTSCGRRGDILAMLLRSRCAMESLEVREMHSTIFWTEEEREELVMLVPTLTVVKLVPFAA